MNFPASLLTGTKHSAFSTNHVTDIDNTKQNYWWSFGTKPLSLTVSEIFNVKCNALVDVTLI